MRVSYEQVGGRSAQKNLEGGLIAPDRQLQKGLVEGEPAARLAELDRRAEEQAIFRAMERLDAAKVDEPERQPSARQPANHPVQDDPVGAIGESGTRRPALVQFDTRQPVAHNQFAVRLLEHQIQKAQGATQRRFKIGGVQQTMTQERKTAGPHRSRRQTEEFVVERLGERQPHSAVRGHRDWLDDGWGQARRREHALRGQSAPAKTLERLLDE